MLETYTDSIKMLLREAFVFIEKRNAWIIKEWLSENIMAASYECDGFEDEIESMLMSLQCIWEKLGYAIDGITLKVR